MFIRHPPQWFQLRSEGARNWLALALLLAAWNFGDDDAARPQTNAGPVARAQRTVTVRTLRTLSKAELRCRQQTVAARS